MQNINVHVKLYYNCQNYSNIVLKCSSDILIYVVEIFKAENYIAMYIEVFLMYPPPCSILW